MAVRPPEAQVHCNSTFFLARKFYPSVRRGTKKTSGKDRKVAENAEDKIRYGCVTIQFLKNTP